MIYIHFLSCMQYLPRIYSCKYLAKYELEMFCNALYYTTLGTITILQKDVHDYPYHAMPV